MNYDVVIGLEVHVQLLTKTKIFCGCVNKFNPDNPNVQTCPVCLGLPGSLPVMNREAFQLALKTGIALNGRIPHFTKWDRKQYYYPDLPKGYQISQYDLPYCDGGYLKITTDSETRATKRIRLIRVHLEEDAGKNMHDESGRGTDSQVDLNRAGTPLMEIVSEPDISSPLEARLYLEELKLLLTYLDVSDCNMQEGSLRCDANVNLHIHADGAKIPTPIVEIKNLNSFRGVEAALEHVIGRQVEAWNETGHRLGDVPKETWGWDAERGVSFAQRGKEEASDYRYFPDPDLVPVTVTDERIEEIQKSLCELPAARRNRLQIDSQLSHYDASVIIDQGQGFADYFEEVADGCGDSKQAANWVTQDVLRDLNERKLSISRFAIPPGDLAGLLSRVVAGEISIKSAREVFNELLVGSDDGVASSLDRIDHIIKEKGLALVTDTGELDVVIAAVIQKNEKTANDVRGGKQAAVGPLIGQVMKQIKAADPKVVRQMLLDKINS